MPVNFRPCQCVLCWLLPWLLCPLTVSPPILLCQLPVSCRARGVDWAGCKPKPGWESKTHKFSEVVLRYLFVLFGGFTFDHLCFLTGVNEAHGKCICVHPQLYITRLFLSNHPKFNTCVPSMESLWLESPAPAAPSHPSPPTPVPCAGHEAWLAARTSSASPFSPCLIGSDISKQPFEQTV